MSLGAVVLSDPAGTADVADVPDEDSDGCGIVALGLRAGCSPAYAAALRSSRAFFKNSPSLGWPAGRVVSAKFDRA